MDSVKGTRTLATAMAAAENPPAIFLSGSAIGYYGDTDDQRISEESPAADDFAALVTIEWEKEAADRHDSHSPGLPAHRHRVRLLRWCAQGATAVLQARYRWPYR